MLLSFIGCQQPVSDLTPVELRCEYLSNPLGIELANPRIGWKLEAKARASKQSAYRLLVASSEALLHQDQGDLWDSQKVRSDETVNIKYQGKSLTSETTCYWKVKVWDKNDLASDWSKVGYWSMGLLQPGDWKANWIGYDQAWADSSYKSKPWANNMKQKTAYRPLPCPHLRKEFSIQQPVASAKAYITALGIYALYINGQRVGNDYFAPGWADYRQRIYYNTYDVAPLLQEGQNTIAVILADGWYAGNIANKGQYFYGKQLRLKAQIKILFDDQQSETIVTDQSWKASYGPILESDMQGGETYDARLAMPNWTANGFDDSEWAEVVVSDTTTATLQPYPGPTVQQTGEIQPISVKEHQPGVYIVNMGQNFAGWARLSVKGERGDKVVMRFAEKLNEDGSLHTRNLRTARCTDTYILKGNGEEIWEPNFTYHGFQYIEITGYPGTFTLDKVTGVVLHSNLPLTGQFICSNELINSINSNIVWSQRSNYFEVPTDCPQRDERMGWTGDAQTFMPTASYNMDLAAFFTKWLVDVNDGQFDDGRFPSTAPKIYLGGAAGWGDAGVICPWNLFQYYNDTLALRSFYPGMVRYMDYLEQLSTDNISGLGGYGDWQNVKSETPKNLIATAYFKRCSDLMAQIAALLERPEDEKKYTLLSANIFEAFNREFVTDSAKIEGHTQTAYLMALSFDLLPDSLKEAATQQLLQAIEEKDFTHTTGILGTSLLLPTLTQTGNLDLAYRLLLNTQFPSWGHHIANGATTIWERWDSYSDEAGFHEDSTNSLNHYAYGAVGEWMYSTIAGIRSDGPGYKQIILHPQPGGGLTHASAEYNSVRGLISSSWKLDDGQFTLSITVPANTTATVFIPSTDEASITEGGVAISTSPDVQVIRKEAGTTVLHVGSGQYHFRSSFRDP